MWENLKTNYMINQKAQAILELATFGSVVLFCLALLIHFGLQMNYQQNVQMQAFRKGLTMAYNSQGPASQASLAVIKEKPVVDPRDRWGFADRVPVGGGASITWSNTLNGVYVNSVSDTPDNADLPSTHMQVNDWVRSFSTAGFGRVYDVSSLMAIGIYADNSGGTTDYVRLTIDPKDVKVFQDAEDPQQKYAYYISNGLKRTLGSVFLIRSIQDSVDFTLGKLRSVSIIAVAGEGVNGGGTDDCDGDNYCGTLKQILYIDPTKGEVDTYYTDVKPWDKDKTLAQKQGLLTDYEKKLDYGSGAKITTTETNTGIFTKTESAATQTVTHKIRLNNGTVIDVPKTFFPNQAYNYTVTHE